MFVPVGCSNCGKPFQVPDAVVGKPAVCPWCQAAVAALPVGTAVEPPPPAATAPAPKWLTKYTTDRPKAYPLPPAEPPLSLDDEPSQPARVPPERPSGPVIRPAAVVGWLAVGLAVMALTVAVRGYGSGRVREAAGWAEFVPPDSSCAVLLPGTPVEEDVPANPAGSVRGGSRFVAEGWYTRSAAWLAWNELDPGFAATAAWDRDKALAAAAIKAELDCEKARLQGTVVKEAEVRTSFAWGVEVHMDTPRGKVVEWLLVAAAGRRPRLYVYGLRATNIAPDSAVVRRMFTSFRVNE